MDKITKIVYARRGICIDCGDYFQTDASERYAKKGRCLNCIRKKYEATMLKKYGTTRPQTLRRKRKQLKLQMDALEEENSVLKALRASNHILGGRKNNE